jgi:N-acetylglucosamine kinase-like BadF-type ATPase
MGDEGSGYAIALAGLRLAAGSADGREPRTQLLPRFQERLVAATPDDLIQRVYAPPMTREGIAALAVEVFAAAADGDELAQLVVEWAAGDLAAMVAVLASRLRLASGSYPLALAGSVLLNQQVLAAALIKELQAREAAPQATMLVCEPVRGALAFAKRLYARS